MWGVFVMMAAGSLPMRQWGAATAWAGLAVYFYVTYSTH